MAKRVIDDATLTDIADAVREKTGGTDGLLPAEMPIAIKSIKSGIELMLVVSVETGATVTATNGDHTLTAVSVNGVAEFSLPSVGTWSVTATKNGVTSGTELVVVDNVFNVAAIVADPVLNNNSWANIKKTAADGLAADVWSIGDCKQITLNGTIGTLALSNYQIYAFILGINHNAAIEGANLIHFQLGKTALSNGTTIALCDSAYGSDKTTSGYFNMSTNRYTEGGWAASNMRNNICGTSLTDYTNTVIGALPSDLRAVLSSVKKYSDNTGSGTANTYSATTEYVFILDALEVANTSAVAPGLKNYQKQYAYFAAGNSAIAYRHTSPSAAVITALRSPVAGNDERWIVLDTAGALNVSGVCYRSRGILPCFCVGGEAA